MLDRRVMACCLRLTWCSQGTLASPTCLRARGGRAASCGRTVSFWRWPALKEPGSELGPQLHLDEGIARIRPGRGRPRGKAPGAPRAPPPHRLHRQGPGPLLLHLLLGEGAGAGSAPSKPSGYWALEGSAICLPFLTHTEENKHTLLSPKRGGGMWWQQWFQRHWIPETAVKTVASSI